MQLLHTNLFRQLLKEIWFQNTKKIVILYKQNLEKNNLDILYMKGYQLELIHGRKKLQDIFHAVNSTYTSEARETIKKS